MNLCSISNCCVTVPIGALEISYCDNGIHSVEVVVDQIVSSLSFEYALKKFASNKVLKEAIKWFNFYFSSSFEETDRHLPSICPTVFSSKGEFTGRVWRTLMTTVPAGQTVSYKGLATLCQNEAGCRAVGTAMSSNPLPILVPCHRVVRENKKVGRYSGGKNVKEWLLTHEGTRLVRNGKSLCVV